MEADDKIQRIEPGARALEARPARPLVTPYETIQLEETPDLLAYWRVIRKRRWTILTIFLVLFTLVLIGTLKMKPIYRARALLEIQKENPNILSVQELFELETVSDTYLETQYKILKSDSLARRVIDELGMEGIEEFNPPRRWWSLSREKEKPDADPGSQVFAVQGSIADRDPMAFQRVLKRFQKRLAVEPVRRSRLVEVSFESRDPVLAARAVNSLAGTYIEQNLEARWEATQKATDWLSQQLLGLKAGLERSEDEMQKYARDNGLLFLQGEKGAAENIMNERLRRMQEELSRAEATRFEKESLFRLVEKGEYGSLPGVFESKLMQDLTVRMAELRREHAELSSTFTPDYPKVKQIQSQIDEIEAVLARERKRAADRIVNDYQAAIAREALLRQAFAVAEAQANVIAEKSVQYNILKREVDTNKQLYEGLLQRMKEAGVSAGLKASNIRIVDPAEPPEKPARPKL
ncbi:MAG: GumC family protein, partial [Candidatus Acidiferrales bacterium]